MSILRCIPLPGVREHYAIGPSIAKFIYDLIHLCYGIHLLSKHSDLKVIHAVEDSCLPGYLLASTFGLPLVFEKHSDPGSYKQSGKFFKNLILSAYQQWEQIVIRKAHSIIGTGDELVQQVHEVAPEADAWIIPDIPSSLSIPDPATISTLRDSLAHQGQILATYVGSFAVYQGIDLLFDAMSLALKGDPNLVLIIIGGKEHEIQERTQQMQKQGVSDRVKFLGFVHPDELPAYLAASDLLLSPRISGRNSPLKVLDYLKAERCIIATDNAANRQILNEDVALLSSPDSASFAKSILQASGDETLRNRLARNAKSLLQSRYHFDYFESQIASLYNRINHAAGRSPIV
ncbi:MAG: glycosyltransferase [Puniceicoccaceae bacterium]